MLNDDIFLFYKTTYLNEEGGQLYWAFPFSEDSLVRVIPTKSDQDSLR